MIVRSLALIPLSRRIGKGINAFISRSSLTRAHFIEMITYKATLVGIRVEVREESYTSKASFLDLDEIPVYDPENKEEHVSLVGGGKEALIASDYDGAYEQASSMFLSTR
jgi:hypothetical protein